MARGEPKKNEPIHRTTQDYLIALTFKLNSLTFSTY